MPTEKQSAASRANAQSSTGPRTESGRANSRFNALKHGIFAATQIIFTESAEDLASLAAEYHERYAPADATERFLVDSLVDNEWLLRRMRRAEAEIWDLRRRHIQLQSSNRTVVTSGEVFFDNDAKFAAVQRTVAHCQRSYYRALKELQALIAARHALPSEAAEPALAPQPEESKPTSESPASFHTNLETAAPTAPKAAPELPENLQDEQIQRQMEAQSPTCAPETEPRV